MTQTLPAPVCPPWNALGALTGISANPSPLKPGPKILIAWVRDSICLMGCASADSLPLKIRTEATTIGVSAEGNTCSIRIISQINNKIPERHKDVWCRLAFIK